MNHIVHTLNFIDGIIQPTTLAAIIGIATLGILFISLVKTFSERNQAIMNQLATEEQNKKDNELYRAILASMLEGVIVFDMDGNVITANYTASKTFGIEHSFLLKTKLSDNLNFLKEDGSILSFDEYQVRRALKEKRAIRGEVIGFDQGLGYIQWLLVNVEPLYSPNGGDMTGVVCTFTDITEQEKAGQKILEYNSLLMTMIENLNFGVVVTDKDDKLIVRNQMFNSIFKLEDNQENLAGMTIEDVISESQHLFPDVGAFASRLNEILEKQEPAVDELKFTDKRIIERHYVPFYYEKKYIGNLWILKDITQQKNLENQLIRSSEEAIKANRAKSEFLSKMSHELRTPLNGIFGFAQLLELDESLTDEQMENVEEILKAGRYLLNLINDVLDLARVEAGSLQIVSNHVDLEKILSESVNMVMPMAHDKNIKIIQEIEKTKEIFIDGDPVRLKQIFINLLDNAIKYNLKGGKVTVELETSEDRAAVRIRDTGYGIHEADFENIFIPFYRSSLTSQQISGTGIGLPLAKQLVESMGGSIAVESQIGMGSSFTVLFPLVLKNKLESQNKITLKDVTKYGDVEYHLLYIEDNESNRTIIKKYFDAIPNITVSCVDFGYAGIQLAGQYHFDLILLDLNLPDIHGFEVFKMLRQNNKDVPVIAVSANAIQQDVTKALSMGFAEYITKPFDFSRLHHVISEILSSK